MRIRNEGRKKKSTRPKIPLQLLKYCNKEGNCSYFDLYVIYLLFCLSLILAGHRYILTKNIVTQLQSILWIGIKWPESSLSNFLPSLCLRLHIPFFFTVISVCYNLYTKEFRPDIKFIIVIYIYAIYAFGLRKEDILMNDLR